MPTKPKRYCARCRSTHAGQCPEAPKKWQSKSTGKGRGGSKWRAIREAVFERDEYLCQEHQRQGIIRPVELHGPNHGICDHIIPKSEGGTDADSNLQTLCQDCSEIKTRRERQALRGGGGIKTYTPKSPTPHG